MPPTINTGATVALDYTLTVDGKVVDASKPGAPLNYVQGSGQIIPGLEQQLAGLKVGDERDVTVTPENGYGAPDATAFREFSRAQFPTDPPPAVGMTVRAQGPNGQPIMATITDVKPNTIKLDFNHPLAGKTLKFHVKVVSIAAK